MLCLPKSHVLAGPGTCAAGWLGGDIRPRSPDVLVAIRRSRCRYTLAGYNNVDIASWAGSWAGDITTSKRWKTVAHITSSPPADPADAAGIMLTRDVEHAHASIVPARLRVSASRNVNPNITAPLSHCPATHPVFQQYGRLRNPKLL